MELALEEINAAGGVLGRKLEIVSRDDGGTPGDAVRVAEELISREKVNVLMGTFASNVGLAVANLAAPAQGAVPRLRAAHRQDRLGERQPLHLPPAALDLHADRDADPRGGEAEEEALGDRLSQLRVRPVGDRVVQEAAEAGAARRRVRRRAGAAARQDRRRRGGAGARRREARRDLQLAVRRRPAEVRARGQHARPVQEHAGVQPARRRARVPRSRCKDETPEGWWVTGYPWSEINTPEHRRFRDAYQKRWKDYPRHGSVVGYTAVYAVAARDAARRSPPTPRSWSTR